MEAEVEEREGSVEEGKGKEKEEPPPWWRRGDHWMIGLCTEGPNWHGVKILPER